MGQAGRSLRVQFPTKFSWSKLDRRKEEGSLVLAVKSIAG